MKCWAEKIKGLAFWVVLYILVRIAFMNVFRGRKKEREKEEKMKAGGAGNAARGWKKFIIILAVFCAAMAVRVHVVSFASVSGESMAPTMQDGEVYLLWTCDKEPERYDIVKAYVGGQYVVKRVVGMPGDVVEIKDGAVYINGGAVEPDYDFYTEYAGVLADSYMLGSGEYILLGDNREVSFDSRYYGAVSGSCIKGVIGKRLVPAL